MLLPNQNIAHRLPELRELYISSNDCNPWILLEKLADHPSGGELLQAFQEFYREVQATTQPKNEIVKGRAASRVVLIDALSYAKEFVIINSPWLRKVSVDNELILRMTALLERGCRLYIGWGYSRDIRGLHPEGTIINVSHSGRCFIDVRVDKAGNYSAFPALEKLQAKYPDQMELKLLGTHEKYVICDRQFALLGSHNVLSSLDTLLAPRERGWKTTEQTLIEEQIEDFLNAPDLKNDTNLRSEFNCSEQPSDRFSNNGDSRLVAEAMKVVRQRGIINPPFFKNMKNSEIQAFIDQYSQVAS